MVKAIDRPSGESCGSLTRRTFIKSLIVICAFACSMKTKAIAKSTQKKREAVKRFITSSLKIKSNFNGTCRALLHQLNLSASIQAKSDFKPHSYFGRSTGFEGFKRSGSDYFLSFSNPGKPLLHLQTASAQSPKTKIFIFFGREVFPKKLNSADGVILRFF